jgi:hypothetical protein
MPVTATIILDPDHPNIVVYCRLLQIALAADNATQRHRQPFP